MRVACAAARAPRTAWPAEPPLLCRPRRSYELHFSQRVGLADSYLALPGVHASPSAAAGDALVVRVALPGTASAADLAVSVTATQLELTSPLYRLALALPRRVRPPGAGAAPARWDAARAALTITLPLALDGDAT